MPRRLARLVSLTLLCLLAITTAAVAQTADWQPTDGPWGGPIVAVAIAPDTGHLYLAQSQHLAMSTDQGATWAPVPGSASIANILSLTAGQGGRIMAGVSFRGVWWTTDGGATWDQDQITHSPHGGLGASVIAVAVTPSDDMIAMHWRSLNDGDTWLEMTISGRSFAFLSDGTAVAGTSEGVFLSTTNGGSWTPANSGIAGVSVGCLAVTPDDVIFAGSRYGSQPGLYRSPDRGVTWIPVHGGLGTDMVSAVAADPAGRIYAGTVDQGLFVSGDGGDTWVPVSGALPDPQIRSLVTAASGRLYAGFAAAGLHATDDQGASWQPRHAGVPVPNQRALLVLDDQSLLLGALGGGVYRSDDAGATWTLRIAGLSNTVVDALAHGPGGSLLAGTHDGVFASQDGGLTWTRAGTELAGAQVHGLHADPQGRILAWVSSTTGSDVLVWRSDDGGATWQPKFTGDELDFGGLFEDSVMAPDGRLYLGGMSFLVRALVITSGDGGDTWQIHDLEGVAPLQALAAGSDGRVYAAADDEAVLVTDDDGATWTSLGSVPWQTHAAVLVASAPDDLLVGTLGDGVYRSTDGGATWQAFSDGLPGTGNLRPSLSAMAVQAGHVFAGTGNHGLYRSPLDGITATPDDRVPAPTHLTLRNQPNPFNPRTTLNFTLPQTTQARLTLHDLRGRLVRVLAEGTLAVGSHAVPWDGHGADGRAMASGVYLARLVTDQQTATTTLVLAR